MAKDYVKDYARRVVEGYEVQDTVPTRVRIRFTKPEAKAAAMDVLDFEESVVEGRDYIWQGDVLAIDFGKMPRSLSEVILRNAGAIEVERGLGEPPQEHVMRLIRDALVEGEDDDKHPIDESVLEKVPMFRGKPRVSQPDPEDEEVNVADLPPEQQAVVLIMVRGKRGVYTGRRDLAKQAIEAVTSSLPAVVAERVKLKGM